MKGSIGEIAELREALELIESSASWRLTKPLRAAKSIVGRGRGRGLAAAARGTRGARAPSRLGAVLGRLFGRHSKHIPASPAADAQLRIALLESGAGASRSGPLVSIVIPTRDGRVHLARLLPALAMTAYEPFEVIVVDGGSSDGSVGMLEAGDHGFPVRVIRQRDGAGFATSVNQGIRAGRGDLVLLLNNDTEPASSDWLGSMVDAVAPDDVACAGSRLIYPRRQDLRNEGDTIYPDLTVQHRGVHFAADPDGMPRARHLGSGEDPLAGPALERTEVPAVTAACMLAKRAALEQVGLLDEGYRFGTEDVDLCLRFRERGWRIIYDGGSVLFHHEYGTQNAAGAEVKRQNRIHNRARFADRWGPRIWRQVFLDRLLGAGEWSSQPLRVGITVTSDFADDGFGDYYTAHELGDQLAELGLAVTYLEAQGERWRAEISAVDVLVCLLDRFPLDQVPRAIVSVAWVRNWTERWIERPWFDDFDLVFASSRRSQELIASRSSQVAQLMPLATNPERFARREPDPELAADLVFAGNRWGVDRQISSVLPELAAEYSVRAFGSGWEGVAGMEASTKGPIAYERLPALYSSAGLVIDDSGIHALPYGAVNSRVFDALACGTLVASNDAEGVRELFDEDFPVWREAADLRAIAERVAGGSVAALTERYRQQVLSSHTYRARAEQLREALREWAEASRFGIAVGVPERGQSENWGDYHYARAIQRRLVRAGHPTRVHLLEDWQRPDQGRDDACLHIFGLSSLQPREGQLTILWNISHPELITPAMLDGYDLALVASKPFARETAAWTSTPVHHLAQATDPERFFPDDGGPEHELLFVGNSRKVRREVVHEAAATNHHLAVYGADWTPELLDPSQLAGDGLANAELRRHYSGADVVLNDHWPQMRALGFLSNRLYDALACGACVVSDHVDGIEAEFDDAVVTFAEAGEIAGLLDRLIADPAERRARGARGREAVLARHTFGHRTDRLLGWVEPLLADRPATVEGARD